MVATLRQVKAAAKKLGATFTKERHGDGWRCGCEAPPGQRWVCSEVHELVDWANLPWPPDYDDLLERMAYGIEPCPDPDCEWCHPVDYYEGDDD